MHLTPLKVLSTRKRIVASKITPKSKIFKAIIKAIQERKGENIVSLDLRKIPEAVADFFIICQATSNTQIKAIGEHVEELTKKECKESPYKHEGFQSLHWVLIDYINIVVHIMQPDTRKFYQLEEMWSDAIMQEHNS